MKLSSNGKDFIQKLEGLSLAPYPDANGYSIGYGHFIKPEESYLMQGITREQADKLFDADIKTAESLVNSRVRYPLNQNQFDALVSLAYNAPIALTAGTVEDKLNAGQIQAALATWEKYNKVRDKNNNLVFNQGLHNRRIKEIDLFTKPYYPNVADNFDKKKF